MGSAREIGVDDMLLLVGQTKDLNGIPSNLRGAVMLGVGDIRFLFEARDESRCPTANADLQASLSGLMGAATLVDVDKRTICANQATTGPTQWRDSVIGVPYSDQRLAVEVSDRFNELRVVAMALASR